MELNLLIQIHQIVTPLILHIIYCYNTKNKNLPMGYSQKLWVTSFYTDKTYWIHQTTYLIELMERKMKISHLALLVTITM